MRINGFQHGGHHMTSIQHRCWVSTEKALQRPNVNRQIRQMHNRIAPSEDHDGVYASSGNKSVATDGES
jgi:hypothetical protein